MCRAARPELTKKTPTIRPTYSAKDVETHDIRVPWRGFFHIDERDFRYRRFDGEQSDLISRATYVTCDAVNVLPYDPVRDRIMLIEQFRIAAHVRGDALPWVIECPAGRIDPGETPEFCARRETHEECGLSIDTLLPVANFYPSVGGYTGYFHTFVGLCDIPDDAAGSHGLKEESEDIKTHIVDFSDALEMLENGDFNTGPLILLLLWLAPRRHTLASNA